MIGSSSVVGHSRKSKVRPMAFGGSPDVAPAPHDGDPAPTSTSTKPDIVAWLMRHGVTLSEDALMHLSKDELLDLVRDLLD